MNSGNCEWSGFSAAFQMEDRRYEPGTPARVALLLICTRRVSDPSTSTSQLTMWTIAIATKATATAAATATATATTTATTTLLANCLALTLSVGDHCRQRQRQQALGVQIQVKVRPAGWKLQLQTGACCCLGRSVVWSLKSPPVTFTHVGHVAT